jgi:catechol 2,3-dioxygenase-like lactoylglutathione lyase family enzyme
MIDHVSVPVSDLDRALAFYTAALVPLGYKVIMRSPTAAGLGAADGTDLWLGVQPVGHSLHIALRAPTRSVVDAFHAAALAAGGKDNGAPGVRAHYHPHYYGGFVLDPDGHNLEAVCHEPYLG